jgi:type II secretory pathway component GspD/PulD (secretin)
VAGVRVAAAEDLEHTLVVGEQTFLSARGVKNFSVGASKKQIDVRLTEDGKEFIIAAMSTGTATLLLIYEDGRKRQHVFYVVQSRERDDAVFERENIRLDFYFVELSETYGHQVGIGWPTSFGGAGIFRTSASVDLQDRSVTSASMVVSNQPLPRLDILQSSGWAKIARQAALVTANGKPATFSSGGEVNLSVQGALTAEIRTIDFGSTIKVRPRYDDKTRRIELSVSADVSDLTDDRGSGIPGRTVSKLNTIVNLELGQSIMLAGLNSHSENYAASGLPLLSQIPVLGALFGSRTARDERRKVVLFIVPSVVDVVSAKARDRIGEALKIYSSYDGDLAQKELVGEPPEDTSKTPKKRKK